MRHGRINPHPNPPPISGRGKARTVTFRSDFNKFPSTEIGGGLGRALMQP
jgi:hypothetical protein